MDRSGSFRIIIFMVFIFFGEFPILVTAADQIRLINGDVISGKFIDIFDGILKIKTDYAGFILVESSQIEQIKSDVEYIFLSSNKRKIKGKIIGFKESKILSIAGDNDKVTEIRFSEIDGVFQKPIESIGFFGSIQNGVSMTSGNTDTSTVRLEGDFGIKWAEEKVLLGLVLNRSENQGNTSESNWRGQIKYDRFLKLDWYMFYDNQAERDRFKDLDLRVYFGLGLGYLVFKRPSLQLALELGVSHVKTDYYQEGSIQYEAGRWAIYFCKSILSNAVNVFHTNTGVFGISNSDNLFIRSQTGLNWPITKDIFGTIEWEVDWDQKPADGKRSVDRILLLNMGYKW